MSFSYKNSVLFSEKLIEELNDMIKDEIDPRLYFAAYYSPKRYCSDSTQYLFWCAVTNAYGLFRDCCRFIDLGENSILDVLNNHGLISQQNYSKIKSHIYLICNLRSLFCHNSSETSSQSKKQFGMLVKVMNQNLESVTSCNLPYNIQCSNDKWEQVLEYICHETDNCIAILFQGIKQIKNHPKSSEMVVSWLKVIIEWYEKDGNLIYTVAENFYDLQSSQNRGRKQTRNRASIVKSWININGMTWKEAYQRVVPDMISPALPFETTYQIIEKTNPQII